jgi:protein O-mannosyl-transferase
MHKKFSLSIIAVLIIASLIAYGRILNNDFVNFDDNEYITENEFIKSGLNFTTFKWVFTAVVSSNWHPLTLLSHALDWTLFREHAGGHHLMSLLLHIGSTVLLYLFLKKTTNNLWSSAFVAFLFALHPLRVESVAWASERKDVLSLFFGMAVLYAYAMYVEKQQLSKYMLCLLLFILALMAKPMLVTLPFILMLLDYWPLKRWQKALQPEKNISVQPAKRMPLTIKGKKHETVVSEVKRKEFLSSANSSPNAGYLILEKAPFIVLAIIFSIVTIWAQYKGMASFQKLPFPERMANALVSYISYLGKSFWPVDLAVFYPYQYSYASWQILGSFFILLSISIAVIYFAKKAPFLLVGWLWYLGTLVPVIGLVQVGSQAMADRYTYLPSIGIGIILAWGIPYLLPSEKMRKIILIPAAAIVLTVLTILTWQQCGYWKNSMELFNHALQVTKNNYLAHDGLGVTLNAEGKQQEAIYHYKSAIKINPDYAYAYYNLANAFKDQKNMEEAAKNFRETIRVNPNFKDAHNNLGLILELYYNKYDEAIYHYQQEIKTHPDGYNAYYNLGIALARKGELQKAIEHFRKAVYLRPDLPDARKALRLALESEKQN